MYGVDLSAVPALRPQRANIEYIQGDILRLARADADADVDADADGRLENDSFDYVFSRFLMGGITDWEKYVELCIALAKPGVSDPNVHKRWKS